MRATPWDGWTTAWAGGMALAETMAASAEVIAARLPMLFAAWSNPATGNWRELNRMVPEKLDAFSRAGTAAATDIAHFQADALAAWTALAAMAGSGRVPTVQQVGALMKRMADNQARSNGAAGRALAPIHRTSTANARRLRRG